MTADRKSGNNPGGGGPFHRPIPTPGWSNFYATLPPDFHGNQSGVLGGRSVSFRVPTGPTFPNGGTALQRTAGSNQPRSGQRSVRHGTGTEGVGTFPDRFFGHIFPVQSTPPRPRRRRMMKP